MYYSSASNIKPNICPQEKNVTSKPKNDSSQAHLASDQTDQKTFRYYRYDELVIKHIENDSSDSQSSNLYDQQTCISILPQIAQIQLKNENTVPQLNIENKLPKARDQKLKAEVLPLSSQEKHNPSIINDRPQILLHLDQSKDKSYQYHRNSQLTLGQKNEFYPKQLERNYEPLNHLAQSPSNTENKVPENQKFLPQYQSCHWKLPQLANLPSECIQRLKAQKIQVFNRILNFLQISSKTITKKNILYVFGNKQTGKKTLIFQAIKHYRSNFKEFYLNFSTLSNKYKAEALNLFNYLKIACEKQRNPSQELPFILIINSVQIFVYFLKKYRIYHQFKRIVKKGSIILILVDKQQADSKKLSWICENGQMVEVPNNNTSLFAASLIDYINCWSQAKGKVIISRPLVNLFSTKLNDQSRLQLGIIPKFIQYVFQQMAKSNSPESQQAQQISFKISRQLIQQFQTFKLGTKRFIQLQNLNLHQKVFLVSCYLYLKEKDQVAISITKLQQLYKWVCNSLSIEAMTLKLLERDVMTNLETYRVIKLLKEFGNLKEKHAVLNISLSKIRQDFENSILFRKFFEEREEK